jgi:hypothetical protein
MTDLGTVHYVTPGGVSCRLVVGGGTVAMRHHNVHLHQPWGLLDELERGGSPVPWASAEEREAAVSWLASAPAIEEPIRARLLAHVRSTPVYDWGTA